MKSRETLKSFWGYDQFRPLQEDIVESVLYGKDTFAVLPTGGGKSICFQVPGLIREGICIVISPLIALMQDQVANLKKRNIKALYISSGMSYREIDSALDNARFGQYKFLYTSPERLKSRLFIERFKLMQVALIVVDESHCISEWGHDFRPAFREIARLRDHHPETPIIALTASATKRVREDILKRLELRDPTIIIGSVNRSNISYQVFPSTNKNRDLLSFCIKRTQQTGIIYCQTRRRVKELALFLRANKISAGIYHGGMNAADRRTMLDAWMNDQVRVMIATNAFGMGIDKATVRFVLHDEIPNSLEAYYQEAGRAGRDELEALAVAFWTLEDIHILRNQITHKYPSKERIQQVYDAICNHLKVAIGSGMDESYPVDLIHFSKVFHFSVQESYAALKILETNGNLMLLDQQILPTRLTFLVGQSELYKFQVGHEVLSPLITLLIRSYPGLFDQFITINESELAKRLNLHNTVLRTQLEQLEQYGLIDLKLQSKHPVIQFTQGRIATNLFSLTFEAYEGRKQIDTEKAERMIEYITGNQCRAESLAAYFDSPTEKCGKCDICLAERSGCLSLEELYELIPGILPADIRDISRKLNESEDSIRQALNHLLLQEKIRYDEGVYCLIA